MAQDTTSPGVESPRRRSGLLRDQVQAVKKDSDRYEIVPIGETLSFEKGFFIVIRACQLLAQKNDGLILVGVAGPSGAGKTVFTEKVLNFMPSIAVITMDNYNDSSRIIDGNFDDPRLTDYNTLLDNIHGLKAGEPVQVPIYDFKTSSRIGYRTVEVPSSRIVIIEGIYALSERLRPLLDLRVSVTGGVHFDLVKRVLRDIQRAGQEPEEIIHQISETVYPMYKAFIEPDLQTAHIKIINKFNPFSGFQNPTYILKSTRSVTVEQIKTILSEEYKETREETYDIYLLPPGEDPEACQSYLRMRNRDGKYNLMFEEWVTDSPFIISPRITFEVSVRLLGGLMALGYTIATILKRSSHIFCDDRVSIKTDWLEQLNRHYVQVQGKERLYVKYVAEQLGLDGSYVPRTYIEQIQLEKLVNDVMALPDDLKTKLSIDDDLVSSPKEALSRASADRRNKYLGRLSLSYSNQREKNLSKLTRLAVNNRRFDGRTVESPAAVANQGVITQLSEQISTLNERMDEFTSRIEELNSKFSTRKVSASQQNLALQGEPCNGSGPTSLFVTGLGNGSLTGSILPNSSSSSQLTRESPLMEEVLLIARGQRQIMHQLDNLTNLLHEHRGERSRADTINSTADIDSITFPLILTLAIGGLGVLLFSSMTSRK
ncbi:inorganic pyrophosphatase TTM1-like isoform X2 [Populus nigra]|uniref:inorganic pyrophosphatase TTM1-like isoform X2 n=1 Tax=Populus nigra TaxID=3691 RepID=UPI002B266C91|nr:inorganic pyrophosphatase TTM1-like isoform X2 [Populus nigra]